ncbi:hypothetical protein ACWD4J_11805 [Streptomyces sp. NPDC002577]
MQRLLRYARRDAHAVRDDRAPGRHLSTAIKGLGDIDTGFTAVLAPESRA